MSEAIIIRPSTATDAESSHSQGDVPRAVHDASAHDMPLVGDLISSKAYTLPSTRVRDVADRFQQDPTLESIALVEAGAKPVGLVVRTKLLMTLSQQYGYALYAKDPITELADMDPLIVDASLRLDEALQAALARPEKDVYDDIIVTDGGVFAGLLSIRELILHQSTALTNTLLQRELARERARELEKISAMKSQFIANVTHELRAPVNAIIGIAELLQRYLAKGDMAKLQEMLALMLSSATSLRGLVGNILDLSKLEAGKMTLLRERFDMVSLLRDVAATTRVLVGNKPVRVEVLAHDGPVEIVSDPVKVKQILTNLTSNAAKFTEEGHIALALQNHPEEIAVVVSDTGIGIKPEHQSLLFEAFAQVEDVKTKRHDGTGLGLAITRNLVELLRGRIELQSTYGKGTTFTVWLPKTPPQQDQEGPT